MVMMYIEKESVTVRVIALEGFHGHFHRFPFLWVVTLVCRTTKYEVP